MKWKEGDPITFDHGLLEQFGNYKIDEAIYNEIPDIAPSEEDSLKIAAVRKSSKLTIRLSERMRRSIRNFSIVSTVLSFLMLCVTIAYLVLIIRGQ